MQSECRALGRLNYFEYALFTMVEFKGPFLNVFCWRRKLPSWQLKRRAFSKHTLSQSVQMQEGSRAQCGDAHPSSSVSLLPDMMCPVAQALLLVFPAMLG